MELVPEQQTLEQFLKRADNGFDFFKAEIIRQVIDKSFIDSKIKKLQSQPGDEGGERDREIEYYTILLKRVEQENKVYRRRAPLIYRQAEGILDNYHNKVRRTQKHSNEADSSSFAVYLLLTDLNKLEEKAR
jgi:hypothetical protein